MGVCHNSVEVSIGPTPLLGGVPLPQFPYLISLDSGRGHTGHLRIWGLDECKALRTVFFFYFIGSE